MKTTSLINTNQSGEQEKQVKWKSLQKRGGDTGEEGEGERAEMGVVPVYSGMRPCHYV